MNRLFFYYAATFFGILSHSMFLYGLIIFARHLTGKDAGAGTLFFAFSLPILLFSMYAGSLADKVPQKRLLLVAQMASAAMIFLSALSILLGWIDGKGSIWILYVCAAFYGLFGAFVMPTRMAIIGNIVDHSKVEQTTIINNLFVSSSFFLGPFVAGQFLGFAGWSAIFFGSCLMMILSKVFLFFLPVRWMKPEKSRRRPWHDLKQGMIFVKNTKLLWQIMALAFVMFAFFFGPYQVLLPQFAKGQLFLTEGSRGLLLSIFGIGSLLANVFVLVLRKFPYRGKLVLATLGISGILFFITTFVHSGTIAVLTVGLWGLFFGVGYVLVPALLLANSHNEMRGRVMGIYIFIWIGCPALGGMIFSFLSDGIGIVGSLQVAATLAFVLVLFGFYSLKELRRA